MLAFIAWYIIITLLGWLAFPLVYRLFPALADRGFTLARSLRGAGYTGRLRAAGHVIADQYTMARRSGFEVRRSPVPAPCRLR